MKLKEISPENRPIERMEYFGEESLSNSELLAIILKTGTRQKNIIDLSNHILSKYPLEKLRNCSQQELCKIHGIGKIKASQIKAIFELHKRISTPQTKELIKIYSPKQIVDILRPDLEGKEQEHLICIFLKSNKIISKKIITIGTNNQTLISNKDILKLAIKQTADSIIISHNHPQGDPTPSKDDRLATKKLKDACSSIEIILLDHIIIGENNYFSFKENQII